MHHVISYLRLYGDSLERVRAEALEHLSMEQLRAAVAWYHDHRSEIDAILEDRQLRYQRRELEAVAG